MLSTNLTQLAAQSDGKGFQEFAKKVQDSAGIFRRGRILGFMLSVGMTCQLLLDAAHAQLAADKAQSGYTITDLGTLGGRFSSASGINKSGQVVGFSYITGDTASHAFLYNGKMKDLGTLGGSQSRADGINNSGQVVGVSLTSGDAAFHAFLYSDDKMLDLNKLVPALSGWTLTEAFAINDVGQIVGFGTAPNGEERAFLLTPKPKK
jgi:probable HAF family extracellular repeat protein